jgi:hypothetical protein
MKGFLFTVGRFIQYVVLIDLVIFAVTGLICWFGGWRSTEDYGIALTWAGLAIILVGFGSLVGSVLIAGNPTYHYIQSVSSQNLHTRTRRIMRDLSLTNLTTMMIGLAGIIAIAIGQVMATWG